MYGTSGNRTSSSSMMMKNSGSMSLALTPSLQQNDNYGQMSLKDHSDNKATQPRREYNQMYVSKRSPTTGSNAQLSTFKPRFQSLDTTGRKMSEPDILHGVMHHGFPRNEERRNSANILDEIQPENGEEEIFGDYDPESLSSELLDRPDSVFGGRKRGFLKKLSIAKWAGRRNKGGKLDKDMESDSESLSTNANTATNTPLRKSVDDLRSDGVGQDSSVVRTRDHSVTRIQVRVLWYLTLLYYYQQF